MRRRGRSALLVTALGAGAAMAAWANGSTSEGAVHVVEIRAFAFAPDTLLVRRGDTVMWRNRDAVPHTATSVTGGWGSPELTEGGTWRVVVEDGGPYVCALHPSMRGVILAR